MGKIIIIRGLEGSGKSTRAQEIARSAKGSCRIVSADNFFITGGKYIFDPSRLQKAHESCFEDFAEAVVHDGVETVIVDNTNSTRREYAHYVVLGRICGYEVGIQEIPCNDVEDFKLFHSRSQHGVPEITMERMWRRWERDTEAVFV